MIQNKVLHPWKLEFWKPYERILECTGTFLGQWPPVLNGIFPGGHGGYGSVLFGWPGHRLQTQPVSWWWSASSHGFKWFLGRRVMLLWWLVCKALELLIQMAQGQPTGSVTRTQIYPKTSAWEWTVHVSASCCIFRLNLFSSSLNSSPSPPPLLLSLLLLLLLLPLMPSSIFTSKTFPSTLVGSFFFS